ncbi:MAG: hypothetical protein IPO32_02375 [Crocinitomicaceae bacterium]|jgi:hypothetical protein|nr:hypothetical protein [Crocinitomicaceae bacterium]MBK6951408.1 hypothetical protein [Crocinitomicaceae bacterium]MBK9590376.1 hypothetical protein [Crocinitomicaceae bacterium]
MKKYYLKNGTRESGPYLLDDLKYQRITSSSLVKVENGEWHPISQNSDLRFLLATSDGKGNSGSSVFDNRNREDNSGNPTNPKSKLVLAIVVAIFFAAMGMGIVFFLAAR